jgi:hypothetical protein
MIALQSLHGDGAAQLEKLLRDRDWAKRISIAATFEASLFACSPYWIIITGENKLVAAAVGLGVMGLLMFVSGMAEWRASNMSRVIERGAVTA